MSKPTTVDDLPRWILENRPYFQGDSPAIPWSLSETGSKLWLVLGPNGGGKSFFRRIVQTGIRRFLEGVDMIHLSMEGRSGGSMEAHSGFVRVALYGNERDRSTGECSGITLRKAIRNCQLKESPHALYWDEPDIGMSEGVAAGAGIVIREFIEELPELTRAVFITTHSRPLLRQLETLHPNYLHLGRVDGPESLEAFLSAPVTPVLPEELKAEATARFRAISRLLPRR
jgi:hypothetical protein